MRISTILILIFDDYTVHTISLIYCNKIEIETFKKFKVCNYLYCTKIQIEPIVTEHT